MSNAVRIVDGPRTAAQDEFHCKRDLSQTRLQQSGIGRAKRVEAIPPRDEGIAYAAKISGLRSIGAQRCASPFLWESRPENSHAQSQR